MSKMPIIAVFAAFTSALAAFAQAPAVSLQNQEDSTFYYVLDPKGLEGLSAGSPLLASKVAGYFAAGGDAADFASLAPQAETKLDNLAGGSHLLVGFFAPRDEDAFPVRVMALQADSSVGERFYAIFASPAQLTVPRGVGKLAAFARPAGGRAPVVAATPAQGEEKSTTAQAAVVSAAAAATDASELPAIATFSASYDPVVFTRETRGAFTVLPMSESRWWTQPGTRILSVQGARDAAGLRLVLNVPAGFSQSVSYFLYVFDARSAGRENPLTLEIQPKARADSGACILWQQWAAAPRLIGTVKTDATSLELDVSAEEINSGLLAAAGSGPTIDLTTAWYDKADGMWEEFYYATFPAPGAALTR